MVGVGVEAKDTDARDGADGVGDARDLRPVLPLAEVGDGFQERGWHGESARPEGAVEVDGGADQGQVSEGLGEVAQGLA